MAVVQREQRAISSDALLGATSFVAGLIIVVAGNYNVGKGENGGTGPALFTAILCAVVAAALFGFVVSRVRNTTRAAWITAVVGILSIAAFWSGVTPILAAAAVVLVRRANATRGLLIVQWLAVAAAVVAFVGTLVQANY